MIELDHRTGAAGDFAWPRLVDFALGVWIVVSALLWPHTRHEAMQATILGFLIAVVAVWAMFVHRVRYLNAIVAIVLLLSTMGTAHASTATAWQQIVVSIVVFVLSLVPNMSRRSVTA